MLVRCRPLGDKLAEVLLAFSIDLVAIVCGYSVCPVATPDAQPSLAFVVELSGVASCGGLACSTDNKIWASFGDKAHVYDASSGKHLCEADPKIPRAMHSAGVACDGDGNAYIALRDPMSPSSCSGVLAVYSRDGGVRMMSVPPVCRGVSRVPLNIAVDRQRSLLYNTDTDLSASVQALKLDGSHVRHFGGVDAEHGSLAVNSAGDVAVVDNMKGNERILVFSNEGKLLRKFGGQFHGIRGVAVDRADQWIVCDSGNSRVQIFSSDGVLVTSIGGRLTGARGPARLDNPNQVCVDYDGRLWVECSPFAGCVMFYVFVF